MKSDKLPAMPFYTGDYLKSVNVRSCKPDVRGLYIDCLCLLWNSYERGVFIDSKGNPFLEDEIINAVGLDNQNSNNWLTILIKKGLLLKREIDGAYYNDRMVRDENIRNIRKKAGKLGGNPNLVNQNLTKNNNKDNLITEDEDEDVNKDEDVIGNIIVKEIIEDLNKVMSSNYRDTSKKTISLINARLKEKFTFDDFRIVHRNMYNSWGGNIEMVRFLRPETLYGNKFESYLNQKTVNTSISDVTRFNLKEAEKFLERGKNEAQ